MSESVQEGDFKIKSKPTMKNLGNSNTEVKKVNLSEPAKVSLDEPKKDESIKVVISSEEPKKEVLTNTVKEEFTNIQEVNDEKPITDSVVKEDIEPTLIGEKLVKEFVNNELTTETALLPDNIDKLVSFMRETGGGIEDYVRLNADYSSVSDNVLLIEYYKKTKPHLDVSEISFLMEDKFSYDEDIDDDRDIRLKKLAIKEEVANARNFLEQTKSKYYDEIKLRPGVTQEQKKATEFFNRYNQDQKEAEQKHLDFKSKTNKYFSDDFKGFDFDVSGKKFRYGVQDPGKLAEDQSNINNFVGKFLDDKGNVTDAKGYHKALYMASNADTIINHFYEQGKSDATKEIISSSKNPSTQARQVAQSDGFVNGIKVKVLGQTGNDSSKLTIKKIKI
jgi:hypothetical protein